MCYVSYSFLFHPFDVLFFPIQLRCLLLIVFGYLLAIFASDLIGDSGMKKPVDSTNIICNHSNHEFKEAIYFLRSSSVSVFCFEF